MLIPEIKKKKSDKSIFFCVHTVCLLLDQSTNLRGIPRFFEYEELLRHADTYYRHRLSHRNFLFRETGISPKRDGEILACSITAIGPLVAALPPPTRAIPMPIPSGDTTANVHV